VIVLDASALIALVNDEAGADVIGQAVTEDDATISTVNYSEALQKAARQNVAPEVVDAAIEGLGITVNPFSRLDARLTASFYRHRSGLSLADRVCLALARSLTSPVYAGDQLWAQWAQELGVQVKVFR